MFQAHVDWAYRNATADCDHRGLSGRGGDRDGAHLVVQPIVVSVVHDKVEDVGDRLAARLHGGDVPAHDSERCCFIFFAPSSPHEQPTTGFPSRTDS